jgi:hypothetical protein
MRGKVARAIRQIARNDVEKSAKEMRENGREVKEIAIVLATKKLNRVYKKLVLKTPRNRRK